METKNGTTKEGEKSQKGFLKIPNDLLQALLVINLTGREFKVCFLIYRLSQGCQKEWAKVIPANFKSIGIGDSHIKGVLDVLSSKVILIQNEKTKEFKLNTSTILCLSEGKYPDRLEKIGDLIHKQLQKKIHQKGNTDIPEMVSKVLPKREVTTYQKSSPQSLPKREVLASGSKGFSTPKDILKRSIYSDRHEIADKNLSIKEKSLND
jgi:phage replication O-like protein O